jgi:hypothetical protein
MKKLILMSGLTVLCLFVHPQASENVVPSKQKVVINHRMIENFNSIEYPADQLSFAFILANYSFEDARDAMMAYQSGDIESVTQTAVDNYLAGKNKDIAEPDQDVPVKPAEQLLATQE